MENDSTTLTVSIITAVWNKPEVTAKFLVGLNRWVLWMGSEVVIVDDGSKSRTTRLLTSWKRRWKEKLVIVRNEINLGFGPSNNRGVQASKGQIIILINNDVEIRGDFIGRVIEALADNPRQIVCAQLIDWDSGWNKFKGEIITYGNGWFLGMERAVWDELGGFDEQFVPCDYEDMDLGMNASQLGIPFAQIKLPLHHQCGITTRQLPCREAITLANRRKFQTKWNLRI